MKEVNVESGALTRGASVTPVVPISPILLEAEEFIEGLPITRQEFQAWGIDTVDYAIGLLGQVKPEEGDTITNSIGDKFRVTSAGNDTPPYKFTTSSRIRMLVFTVRTSEA